MTASPRGEVGGWPQPWGVNPTSDGRGNTQMGGDASGPLTPVGCWQRNPAPHGWASCPRGTLGHPAEGWPLLCGKDLSLGRRSEGSAARGWSPKGELCGLSSASARGSFAGP